MIQLEIKQLSKVIGADTNENLAGLFTGVSIDSRRVFGGSCFFAIAGENFDGHDFVSQAFENGAACAVINKNRQNRFPGKAVLKVDDTVKALGTLARFYRKKANFKVVALTGSVGKTTTRSIIYHVLQKRFKLHQSPKNFNNHIGLPLTLLSAKPDDEIVLAEIGTSGPGEIAYLTQIAGPDIAMVTNVYPAHLAGLGDLQSVAKEKISIFQGLEATGIFLINGESKILLEACKKCETNFTVFDKSKVSDIKILCRRSSGLGSVFNIEGEEIFLPLCGMGNIENALAAWAVCERFGVTIKDFAGAVKTLPPLTMRSQIVQAGNVTIIDDCYNANPASMKNALEILANMSEIENRRSVFICGEMGELGEASDELHRQLGEQVAKAKINFLIAVGQSAKITAEEAEKTARHDIEIKTFTDTVCACNKLADFVKNYDIVLVKGSRISRLESAGQKILEVFSSKQKAR